MRDLLFGLAIGLVCSQATMARAQGTAEQREACAPDALKLCAAAVPDVARTTQCMKAHRDELSPRCKAAFATEPPAAPASEDRRTASKRAAADVGSSAMQRRWNVPEARYVQDPDAEVPYLPPRRVMAPPLYGDPGPPLNPGGVPYDELFAGPTVLDAIDALHDPYVD